ncbi:ORF890 [White spot syndrome virus]|uniref:ORF890 n=1 Tax=White spot syndrome virus TaxID=342409 RepID=A0A2D3I782_9VIRU|nr:ORF890 [White spot syndrome virus]
MLLLLLGEETISYIVFMVHGSFDMIPALILTPGMSVLHLLFITLSKRLNGISHSSEGVL